MLGPLCICAEAGVGFEHYGWARGHDSKRQAPIPVQVPSSCASLVLTNSRLSKRMGHESRDMQESSK